MQVIDPVVDIATPMRKRPVTEQLRGRQKHRLQQRKTGTHNLRCIGKQRMQTRNMRAQPPLVTVVPPPRSP